MPKYVYQKNISEDIPPERAEQVTVTHPISGKQQTFLIEGQAPRMVVIEELEDCYRMATLTSNPNDSKDRSIFYSGEDAHFPVRLSENEDGKTARIKEIYRDYLWNEEDDQAYLVVCYNHDGKAFITTYVIGDDYE